MSFNMQIMWSVQLIILCWLLQNIEANQLRSNKYEIEQAAQCLKKVIRKDCVPEYAEKKLYAGEYGEYIEEFCEGKTISNIEEKMEKCTRGKSKVDRKIKKCIYDSEYRKIYNYYRIFGHKEINKLHNRSDDPKLSSMLSEEGNIDEILHESDDEDISVDDDEDDDNELHPAQKHLSEEHTNPISGHEANKKEILKISEFAFGMCNADKLASLEELEDRQQKQDTIKCLEFCGIVFFNNILEGIDYGTNVIKKYLEREGIKVIHFNMRNINKMKSSDLIEYFKEYRRTHEENHKMRHESYLREKGDFQKMKTEGEQFLDNYSDMYSCTIEYLNLHKVDIKPEIVPQKIEDTDNDGKLIKHLDSLSVSQQQPDIKKTIDNQLRRSYIIYKNCIKRECLTNKTSVPIFNHIRDRAKGGDNASESAQTAELQSAVDKDERVEDSVQQNIVWTGEKEIDFKRMFFEVLLSEDKDENDVDEGNSSSHS